MLTKQEERKLLEEYQRTKDQSIRWQIVLGNIGFLFFVAKKIPIPANNITIDDLVQEGMVEMYRCVDGYKLNFKVKFTSFCYLSVRERMRQRVKTSRVVYTPLNITPKNKKLVRKARAIITGSSNLIEDNTSYFEEFDAEPEINYTGWREQLKPFLWSLLTPRERYVLARHWEGGLYRDIALEINVSRQRIEQILHSVHRRLKACITQKNSTST